MSLTGIWSNALKSNMLLKQNLDNSLDGIYHSMVGRDLGFRALAGRTNEPEANKQMVVWAVCFEISDPGPDYGHYSVCGWSGWSERDELGSELIKTHWLLTVNPLDKNDDWRSTSVGEDAFLKLTDEPNQELFRNIEAVKDLYEKLRGKLR
jgi:hypothetical protein